MVNAHRKSTCMEVWTYITAHKSSKHFLLLFIAIRWKHLVSTIIACAVGCLITIPLDLETHLADIVQPYLDRHTLQSKLLHHHDHCADALLLDANPP